MDEKEMALIEEERKSMLLQRLEDLRKKKQRSQVFGAMLISLGVFFLVVSWVILGFTTTYLIIGGVGSVLIGAGLYLLVTEPTVGVRLTLADELESIVKPTTPAGEIKRLVEDAVARHPDEKTLGSVATKIVESSEGEEAREKIKELLRSYFG